MTTPALRIAAAAARHALAALTAIGLVAVASPARATDKADCTAAQKAAQADKTAGKPTKALTELATCSRPVCPKAMQKQCTDLAATVLAGQPSVVFSAKDASGNAVTNVTVTVDGTVVTSSLDDSPVALDPGSHAMKFEMDGATTVNKQIDVADGQKGQTVAIDLDANPPAPAKAVVAVKAADEGPGSMYDTTEDPMGRYYFLGLRYRGNVVPKFMLNLFVDGGATLYSNSIGAEIDLRHDNFSLIPALSYTEYGTGDVLFLQSGKDASDPGNWSLINSSLKAIYASVDLLWSVHIANHWEFEYGAGFGLGALFGTLEDNWVYPTKPGQPVSSSNYTACQTTSTPQGQAGCTSSDHNNSQTLKVGGYNEPSWLNGGSKPNIFPLINFPQLGVRYKPIKQLETRFGMGFSLTGFWFGLSADYGLEKPTK